MTWLQPGEKEEFQAEYDQFCDCCDVECPTFEAFLIAKLSVAEATFTSIRRSGDGFGCWSTYANLWKRRVEDMLGVVHH